VKESRTPFASMLRVVPPAEVIIKCSMLYHYTTPDALIGIIKNSCLWATSVFYLNDAHELIHGIEIARRQLERLRASSSAQNEKSRVDWLLGDIRNVGTARSKAAFVCSFSPERDLLSQWRAYCRGGGFSIGFPSDQLAQAVAAQGFSLNECIYNESDQERLIGETIETVVMPWIGSAPLPLNDDGERFKVSGRFTWELVRAASRLKNASFSEEREFRVVSQPERGYEAEKLHFRSRGGLVIPYTTIELPNSSDFWREVRIVVGPTPHPEESKASVYDLVRRYRGHAVGIELTRTPFREW